MQINVEFPNGLCVLHFNKLAVNGFRNIITMLKINQEKHHHVSKTVQVKTRFRFLHH